MIFDSLGSLPLGTIPILVIVDISIDPITHHHYVDNITLTSTVNLSIDNIFNGHKLTNVLVFVFGELGTFEIVLNTTIENSEILFIVKELKEILKVFLKKYNLESIPDQEMILYAKNRLESDLGVVNYFNERISVLNKEITDMEVRKEEVN